MRFSTFTKISTSDLWTISSTFTLKKVNVSNSLCRGARNCQSLLKMIFLAVKVGARTIQTWDMATSQVKVTIVKTKGVALLTAAEVGTRVTVIEVVTGVTEVVEAASATTETN